MTSTAIKSVSDFFEVVAQQATEKLWSKKQLTAQLRAWSRVDFPSPSEYDAKQMRVRVIDYFEPGFKLPSGPNFESAYLVSKMKTSERVWPAIGYAARCLLEGASALALGIVAGAGALTFSAGNPDNVSIAVIGGMCAVSALGMGVSAVTSFKKAFWSATETHYAAVLLEGVPSIALGRTRVPKTAATPVNYPNP